MSVRKEVGIRCLAARQSVGSALDDPGAVKRLLPMGLLHSQGVKQYVRKAWSAAVRASGPHEAK